MYHSLSLQLSTLWMLKVHHSMRCIAMMSMSTKCGSRTYIDPPYVISVNISQSAFCKPVGGG